MPIRKCLCSSLTVGQESAASLGMKMWKRKMGMSVEEDG